MFIVVKGKSHSDDCGVSGGAYGIVSSTDVCVFTPCGYGGGWVWDCLKVSWAKFNKEGRFPLDNASEVLLRRLCFCCQAFLSVMISVT